MNRRRMMMDGEKIPPLYVFERGKSGLTNGRFNYYGGKISGGIIEVGSVNGAHPGYIDIGGIDFSKYRKLKIRCSANIADYESGKELHFAGYGEKTGYQKTSYADFQYAPQYSEVLSFDISKVKGERYIKASAAHTGTATLRISDIWLE